MSTRAAGRQRIFKNSLLHPSHVFTMEPGVSLIPDAATVSTSLGDTTCLGKETSPRRCPTGGRSLPERSRTRYFERVINQRPRPLYESDRMRQSSVGLKRRVVDPARVDVKQPRIARGTKRIDHDAAQFRARRFNDVAQNHCQFRFASCDRGNSTNAPPSPVVNG